MAAPELGPVTATAYARLSEVRRSADAGLDYPLARYLEAVLADVEVIPINDTPPPARGGWWTNRDRAQFLAQFAGIDPDVLDFGSSEQIFSAAFGRQAEAAATGTLDALRAAILPLLGGTQTLQLARHHHGNPWRVRVSTIPAETPEGPGTWGELMAAAPTWGDLQLGGTWAGLGVLQVIGAASLVKEAGVRLVYVPLNPDGSGGDELPPVIAYWRFYDGPDYEWSFADADPAEGDLALWVFYDDAGGVEDWTEAAGSGGRVFYRILGPDPVADLGTGFDGAAKLVVRGYSTIEAVDTADDVADPADPLELDAGAYSPADPDQPGLALVIGIKADGAEIMEPVPAPFTTVLPDGIAEPVAWLELADGDPTAVSWVAGTVGDLTPEQRAVLLVLS